MINVEIIGFEPTETNPYRNAVGIKGDPGVGVPTGGTNGQVLAKNSDEDYDTHWTNMSGEGGSAGGIIDINSGRTVKMWFGSVDEYNALPRKDPDVYYNILEGDADVNV